MDPAHDSDAETSELAIAGVCLSIFWLFGLGSLGGIYLGWRALREIRESDGTLGGRTIALAAIVVGVIGLASSAFAAQFFLAFD